MNNLQQYLQLWNDLFSLFRVPLHAAAWSDSADCLQTLLDRDADVNVTDLSGQTPVIMAAMRGHQMLLGKCPSLDTHETHTTHSITPTHEGIPTFSFRHSPTHTLTQRHTNR